MNIAEILKDKPKGTKLYTPLFGNCTLEEIRTNSQYPIMVRSNNISSNDIVNFTSKGLYYDIEGGDCVIFPSKYMHDWEKLSWKRGDVLTTADNTKQCIFDGWCNDTYTKVKVKHWFDCSNENNHKYLSENYPLTELLYKADSYTAKCYINTIEERFNGKLNPDTLEIEPVKQECTFKPFDKILVRNSLTDVWSVQFFSHYKKESEYPYIGMGNLCYKYCIPYKGNEHLLGTSRPRPYKKPWVGKIK